MKITKDRKQCLDIDPPPSTTNQISKYVLTKCIGRGNFGDVYCAQKTGTKSIVAIKVVNLDDSPDDVKQIIQEIHFLSKLRHNNIVQYIESFTKEYNMYIVMEYCGGGSCSDLLKYHNKLPEDLVAYIIKRVLFGLRYLHSEHKVHRDIKSANVLLTDDGEVKLADFGVSTEITMTKMKKKTFVGTPFWMAPEVITRGRVCEDNNNPRDGNDGGGYDEKADIWSTGITTIELVTGSPPLSQYDPLKILFDIPKKRPPLLSGVDFSEDIKDFVRYCLVKDPAKRQSANKLLYHHFLSKSFNNEATRNKLIRYITQKIKSDKQKNGYKPRYKIINDGLNKDKENSETPIEWEFNDTLTQKETIMEPSPLFKHEKLLEESIISSYYDETRLVSSDDSMILDNRKEGILIHCLQLVQMRGKDEHTRIEVEKFMEILLQFERENPGLCRAIVEEIEKIICN